MSVTVTSLTTLVRYIIGDTAIAGSDIYTYGNSSVFTVSEINVLDVTAVFVNDVELGTSEFSYDSDTKKVTLNVSMNEGDSVEIQYTYYPNFSDTELTSYITSAVVHISINRYNDFYVLDDSIYPRPTGQEQNLIAMIASILIEPDNKDYRLPDISIKVPVTSLPTDAKIRKTIAVFKHNTHGSFDII